MSHDRDLCSSLDFPRRSRWSCPNDVRLLASMVGEDELIVAVGEDFVKVMESSVETGNDESTTVGGTP